MLIMRISYVEVIIGHTGQTISNLKYIECHRACASCNIAYSYNYNCDGCNPSYYPLDMGGWKACKPCDPSCSACNGMTAADCLTCSPGYYYQPGTIVNCSTTCPSGFMPDNTTQNCLRICPNGQYDNGSKMFN